MKFFLQLSFYILSLGAFGLPKCNHLTHEYPVSAKTLTSPTLKKNTKTSNAQSSHHSDPPSPFYLGTLMDLQDIKDQFEIKFNKASLFEKFKLVQFLSQLYYQSTIQTDYHPFLSPSHLSETSPKIPLFSPSHYLQGEIEELFQIIKKKLELPNVIDEIESFLNQPEPRYQEKFNFIYYTIFSFSPTCSTFFTTFFKDLKLNWNPILEKVKKWPMCDQLYAYLWNSKATLYEKLYLTHRMTFLANYCFDRSNDFSTQKEKVLQTIQEWLGSDPTQKQFQTFLDHSQLTFQDQFSLISVLRQVILELYHHQHEWHTFSHPLTEIVQKKFRLILQQAPNAPYLLDFFCQKFFFFYFFNDQKSLKTCFSYLKSKQDVIQSYFREYKIDIKKLVHWANFLIQFHNEFEELSKFAQKWLNSEKTQEKLIQSFSHWAGKQEKEIQDQLSILRILTDQNEEFMKKWFIFFFKNEEETFNHQIHAIYSSFAQINKNCHHKLQSLFISPIEQWFKPTSTPFQRKISKKYFNSIQNLEEIALLYLSSRGQKLLEESQKFFKNFSKTPFNS